MSEMFTCFIIGEGTLAIKCGELLIKKNKKILGVKPGDPSFRQWAVEKNIPIIDKISGLKEVLTAEPFAYLFSIVNYSIIPNEILKLPQKYAINYHDSLLPQYAGLNATSWALMNSEEKHGVSWHIMFEGIDNGDILKQAEIDISPDETVHSLDVKCYETAVRLFNELLDELSENKETLTPQTAENRSYYSRYQTTTKGWVISWDSSAEDIVAQSRALDFGNFKNPLGVQKLYIEDKLIIVKKVEITEFQSKKNPGIITGLFDDSIRVSTGSFDVSLSEFFSINGEPLYIAGLISQYQLSIGYKFQEITDDIINRIDELDKKAAKSEKYWVRRLSGLNPVQFPYLKLNQKSTKKEYQKLEIELRDISSIREYLKHFNNNETLILTAFLAFLSRVSSSDGFDIGFCDLNMREQLVDLDCYFETHVPLKVSPLKSLNFNEFDESVRNSLDEINKRHTYTKDVVIRYPKLNLFSTSDYFNPFEINIQSVDKQGYDLSPCNLINFLYHSTNFTYTLVYDCNSLESQTVSSIANHFNHFLLGVLQHPNKLIQEISIVPETEKQLLAQWNNTSRFYPAKRNLKEMFEDQVLKTPNNIALDFIGSQLTYQQLNQKANQLANHLKTFGVGKESVVGIFMDRSLEMVIGIYSILKAGGAYLPLDPEYPQERISFMVEDSGLALILTSEKYSALIPAKDGIRTIIVDTEWNSIENYGTENLINEAGPENLAYVIYTSGSTGRPKGVMNEHRGICNRLNWMQTEFALDESDCVLQKTPFSFDVSVWEFFWPLLFGSKMVIAKPQGHKDNMYLINLINSKNITTIHFVPSMLQLFLEQEGLDNCISLKRVICSGEALTIDVQRRFFEKLNCPLYNLYGPTEAAVDVTCWHCRDSDTMNSVPIGKPIANTQIHVLDESMQLVPIGVPGELYIGGVQVARGYMNRPDLNKERFLKDIFSNDLGARLYKTGDLVRNLSDGNIDYIGRIDFQVKVRGFRIELGEIEQVLLAIPSISQAVVIVSTDKSSDSKLIAYILVEGSEYSEVYVRDQLKQKLPDYMVPSHILRIDAFPLTANGKLNRLELPTPGMMVRDTPLKEPKGDFQQGVLKIWKEVLNVEEIGVEDNFFDLGGHSFSIVRVHDRLKEDLKLEVSILDLFQYPTVFTFVDYLKRKRNEETSNVVENQRIESELSLNKRRQLRKSRIGQLRRD